MVNAYTTTAATSSVNGGVLQITSGTYTMKSGTISGITANNGGAIYVGNGGKFILDGGTIENCTALNGGAIYVDAGGSLEIKSGSITNCNATERGGAIYAKTTGDITIDNVPITGCSAKRGGAICNMNTNTLTIGDATQITNCSAAEKGSAIYLNRGKATISAIITYCSFTTPSTSTNGTIYADNDTNLNLASAVVENCTGAHKGGAVYMTGTSKLKAENVMFQALTTSGNGGAISSDSALATTEISVEILDCTFDQCYAKDNGGAVCVRRDVSISNSSFSECEAREDNGGAICAAYGKATITDNTIIENCKAVHDGGGVYCYTLNMQDSTVSNCQTGKKGGGIVITASTTQSSIFNCKIFNCKTVGTSNSGSVSANGGGIHAGNLTIENSQIYDCESVYEAGGIYNFGTLILKTVDIYNCKSDANGGGIRSYGNSLTMTGGSIYGCTSGSEGGAMRISGGHVTINGGAIIGSQTRTLATAIDYSNKATKGGGIYATGAQVTLDGCFVGRNYATLNGGGICSNDSMSQVLNFKSGTIAYNATAGQGGGIYAGIDTTCNIEKTIAFNYAAEGGGVYGNKATIKISEPASIARNRSETNGGGVFVTNDSTLNVTGGGITYNNALGGSGGAICAYSASSVTISDAQLSNNTCHNDGGAIMVNSTPATISGTIISGNTGYWGGAILGNGSAINISGGSKIYNNQAVYTSDGAGGTSGAIYVHNGSKLTIGDTEIYSNEAKNSLNIYASGSEVTFNTGTYIHDIITSGGASGNLFYAENGCTVTFNGGTFNNATASGTMVCVTSSRATINGGIFVASGYAFDMNSNSTNQNIYTLAGNPTISAPSGGFWLAENNYLTINTILNKTYTVTKNGIANYDTAGDVAGARIAYSTNSSYLSSAQSYLSVSNMPSGCSLNSDRKTNYLVVSNTISQTYVRTRYSLNPSYSVSSGSYSSYGGSVNVGGNSSTSYASKIINPGTSYSISVTATAGFEFVGWYTTTSLSGTNFTFYSSSTNVTLTKEGGTQYFVAYFRPYQTTVQAAYGKSNVAMGNATVGTTGGTVSYSYQLGSSNLCVIKLNATAASGYTFAGWYIQYNYSSSWNIVGNTSQYENISSSQKWCALFRKTSATSSGTVTISGEYTDGEDYNKSYTSGNISSLYYTYRVEIGGSNITTFGSKGTYSAGTIVTVYVPSDWSDENNDYTYCIYVNGYLYEDSARTYDSAKDAYVYKIKVDGTTSIKLWYENYTYN